MIHSARSYAKMRHAGFFGSPDLDKSADKQQVKAFNDRLAEPEDIANLAVFLASPESDIFLDRM